MVMKNEITVKRIANKIEIKRSVKTVLIPSYADQAAATAAGIEAPAIFYSVADDAYYAVKADNSFVLVAS